MLYWENPPDTKGAQLNEKEIHFKTNIDSLVKIPRGPLIVIPAFAGMTRFLTFYETVNIPLFHHSIIPCSRQKAPSLKKGLLFDKLNNFRDGIYLLAKKAPWPVKGGCLRVKFSSKRSSRRDAKIAELFLGAP